MTKYTHIFLQTPIPVFPPSSHNMNQRSLFSPALLCPPDLKSASFIRPALMRILCMLTELGILHGLGYRTEVPPFITVQLRTVSPEM